MGKAIENCVFFSSLHYSLLFLHLFVYSVFHNFCFFLFVSKSLFFSVSHTLLPCHSVVRNRWMCVSCFFCFFFFFFFFRMSNRAVYWCKLPVTGYRHFASAMCAQILLVRSKSQKSFVFIVCQMVRRKISWQIQWGFIFFHFFFSFLFCYSASYLGCFFSLSSFFEFYIFIYAYTHRDRERDTYVHDS